MEQQIVKHTRIVVRPSGKGVCNAVGEIGMFYGGAKEGKWGYRHDQSQEFCGNYGTKKQAYAACMETAA